MRKVSILGLFVGPMLNSPKEHDKDFIVDNKENITKEILRVNKFQEKNEKDYLTYEKLNLLVFMC